MPPITATMSPWPLWTMMMPGNMIQMDRCVTATWTFASVPAATVGNSV